MSINMSKNETQSKLLTESFHLRNLSLSMPLPMPLQLYRTHKHLCENCGRRCHIIYEHGKTDCICEQYRVQVQK